MPRQKTVSSGVVSRTRRPKQPEGKAGVARQPDDEIDAEVLGVDPASDMVPVTDEPIAPMSRASRRAEANGADESDHDDEGDDESEDEEEEASSEAAPEPDDFRTVLHLSLIHI